MSTRVYYRITLELMSPLSIGAADSDQTDNDVLLNSKGEPIIPAGSIAGVLRSYFYDPTNKSEDRCKRIFGELEDPDNSSSAVRTFDACLSCDTPNKTVSIRDGVKLRDGEKVPESKKKFDRQIVEAGATFQTCIEVLDEHRCSTQLLEESLGALHTGTLRLGGKSTRGYGRVRITSCTRRRFDLRLYADEWIAFDPLDAQDPAWTTGDSEPITFLDEPACGPHDAVLNLGLKLVGGISIREYQTEAEGVAYSQLTVHGVIDDDGNRVPVIPGTSWAGALLARCKDTRVVQSYGNHAITLFGTVNEQTKEQMRSRVIIDESTVSGGTWKAYTRNSIDRFTGGTVDTALYSEEMYWGGTTKLVLTIRNVSQLCNDPSAALRPLVATLADLHNGFLAVGGLTAVGRGMFTIDQSQSTILVGGTNVTQEFFRAFMGNAANGFAQPNVAAVAKLLSEEPQTKGGAA